MGGGVVYFIVSLFLSYSRLCLRQVWICHTFLCFHVFFLLFFIRPPAHTAHHSRLTNMTDSE